MINMSRFESEGFARIDARNYLSEIDANTALEQLKTYYATSLASDGPRNRAYLKLDWERQSNTVSVSENQNYFQSKETNIDDGGKVREFARMPAEILENSVIQNMIDRNMCLIAVDERFKRVDYLTVGLHFVQYQVESLGASYSSPVGLHIDDEPLVFVHLLELSPNALGGDNLIARLNDQVIQHVIRLEKPMETIVLNNNCYHAVTPLGSREGTAYRNIILFTIEPQSTQVKH